MLTRGKFSDGKRRCYCYARLGRTGRSFLFASVASRGASSVRVWLSVSLDDMAVGGSSREGSFETVVNARSPFVAYGLKTVLLDKEQF